jgi:magnesium chelatase subunit I
MNIENIKTLGELKEINYKSKSIKEELRDNLIKKIGKKEITFPGIIGYEDSVIPDTERALLSRHNILFLGLRGQAKTRMARQMVDLLDEYIPVVEGSEVNDDPFKPLSKYARDLVKEKGDDTPISWLHKSDRYGEKLATPDVSVADLIGDIDPIKAANLKLSYADERVIHYGIIPRSNRGIFVINELPDLQARIQVSLFNILEEGDLQIRGFKLRLPLVTPLKDRIESQILTHYPTTIENSLYITEQEATVHSDQVKKVQVSDLVKRLIEQVSFEARGSEFVDKKSGVSARLTISAYENAISAAERRAIRNKEKETQVWISDLAGIIPSITGKIELVYEGEQEGPYQVAYNLLQKAIRTQFVKYFPNPEAYKKRKTRESVVEENPYKSITRWFDAGNQLNISFDLKDDDKIPLLYKVDGLYGLVKKHFSNASARENALLMEFVLHGLSTFSLISKKVLEGKIEFKDLMGSMINLSSQSFSDEELE